jgi:catechol 2,3-dioxygenase-like lactoylglutathione lyase family enzyme
MKEVTMSTTQTSKEQGATTLATNAIDMRLEVVTIPVSDMERAKEFYLGLGWRQDPTPPGSGVVQITPTGSGCSIHFGTNRTSAAPGSAQNLFLIVSDIQVAHDDLVRRGVAVSEVFHVGPDGKASGPDPQRRSYASLATFSDPDGNRWLLQEITTRLPGRGFGTLDVTTLTELLQEAEKYHGAYEPTAPKHHWSDFYGAYIVAQEQGRASEQAAEDGARNVERNRERVRG